MSKSTTSGSGKQNSPSPASPGVISPSDVYRLDEALHRLGWTESAYRSARRRGLQVLPSGKRRYLRGQEIIRFLIADAGVSTDAST